MASTHRTEKEMKAKCEKVLREATDPLEVLRCQCLARGASGIKGIGRCEKHVYPVYALVSLASPQKVAGYNCPLSVACLYASQQCMYLCMHFEVLLPW
jgi:hypothetical protein